MNTIINPINRQSITVKYGAFITTEDKDKGLCISGNDIDLLNDMLQNVYFDFP